MTKTTQYWFEFKDEITEDETPDNPIDFASHGIIDAKDKININIDPNKDGDDIKENDDNKEILVNSAKKFLVSVQKIIFWWIFVNMAEPGKGYGRTGLIAIASSDYGQTRSLTYSNQNSLYCCLPPPPQCVELKLRWQFCGHGSISPEIYL